VMLRAFKGEITNHDSAIMLGKEEVFEEQELERISGGQEPSPKFRGGPAAEDIPQFEMSKRSGQPSTPVCPD
ncbi:MAG: C4-dicarboxylate transporter DctA, partial [Paenarthrobacter sp.]